ncbi:hypothetical protein V491_02748 [Pseudogymnoascus sp. VKM F-3775]|nr:hypothetical protein V491_02748 [Pseudogymnoascus sp. VKM F-3775]
MDYPDWKLQDVITSHRDRLQNFFFHKGGFTSQASAERFWHIVLAISENPTSAKQTIQELREQYLTFPEATTYGQRETTLTADAAQSILDTLHGADSSDIRSPIGGRNPANLIDIGCAEGQKTSALAKAWGLPCQHAIGLDIIQAKSPPTNIKFETMLPDILPKCILYSSQDLAIVSMVFHHSKDPCKLLKGIHSALRLGGYLIIREHNADARMDMASFLNTVHIFYDAVFAGKPCMLNAQNYKSLEEWQNTFQSQGFEYIKSEYMPFSTNPSAGVQANANTGENFTFVLQKNRP